MTDLETRTPEGANGIVNGTDQYRPGGAELTQTDGVGLATQPPMQEAAELPRGIEKAEAMVTGAPDLSVRAGGELPPAAAASLERDLGFAMAPPAPVAPVVPAGGAEAGTQDPEAAARAAQVQAEEARFAAGPTPGVHVAEDQAFMGQGRTGAQINAELMAGAGEPIDRTPDHVANLIDAAAANPSDARLKELANASKTMQDAGAQPEEAPEEKGFLDYIGLGFLRRGKKKEEAPKLPETPQTPEVGPQ